VGRSGRAGRSNASTTSLAVGRFASCDCLSWSFINAAFRASTGVAAPLAGQLAGRRWASWLGWGYGFLSSVAGFRQFVEFFEVY